MNLALPKRMFRAGSEPQVKKINNRCTMSIMRSLQKLLPEEYGEVKRDHVFRHLVTSKLHELWFVFARIPLCFSEQEFHAITGLKFKQEEVLDFDNWKDDMGFWSKLLKRSENISLKMIKKEHLKYIHKWTYVDRERLIYMCLIAGVLIAKDEKGNIPHAYIKMVMDIDKLWRYPWGREAFDELWSTINWDFQEEAAKPIGEVTADIASGDDNNDDAEEFRTPNARVSTSSGYVKKKKKFSDVGAETRKKKVLCQIHEEFFKGLIQTSFTLFEEKMEKKMDERFVKLENDISQLKEPVKLATFQRMK
ncbi:hypothetical protein N665_0057s0022 [Sinapis alba]|nr:hypothetical protein N665_0057s0022 [Sinapis alba]